MRLRWSVAMSPHDLHDRPWLDSRGFSRILELEGFPFHPSEWRGNERLVLWKTQVQKAKGAEILIFQWQVGMFEASMRLYWVRLDPGPVHIFTHTRAHTHTDTHTHANTQTHTHTRTHTCLHTHIHTSTHTLTVLVWLLKTNSVYSYILKITVQN
jgi:hypothetical protein